MSQVLQSTSEEQTRAAGRAMAMSLRRGDVVALYGELGAGKTQFVKGLCDGFRVRDAVTSPTFVILNRYSGMDEEKQEILLFHFDLYRIQSAEEIYDLGYEEFLFGDGICVVEWAERLGSLLPHHRYDVKFELGDAGNERRISINRIE